MIPNPQMPMTPPDPSGLPPELAGALLASGGGFGEPVGPPDVPPAGTGMNPVEHLRASIEHAQAALVAEPDDKDSQKLAQVIQGLYSILADRQKNSDQALGGNPAVMSMLRQAGQG